MPRLVFSDNKHAPVDIKQAVTIGRSPNDCDITIGDRMLSRAHVRIEPVDDNDWIVVDLGSANGTEVNGRRIKEIRLQPGDKITIGSTDITFEAVGPGAETVLQGVLTMYGYGQGPSVAEMQQELEAEQRKKADARKAQIAAKPAAKPAEEPKVKKTSAQIPKNIPLKSEPLPGKDNESTRIPEKPRNKSSDGSRSGTAKDVRLKSEPIPAEVKAGRKPSTKVVATADEVPDTGEVEKAIAESARHAAVPPAREAGKPGFESMLPSDPDEDTRMRALAKMQKATRSLYIMIGVVLLACIVVLALAYVFKKL